MRKYWLFYRRNVVCLSLLLVGASAPRTLNAALNRDDEPEVLRRELKFFGPAEAGLRAAGFNPSGMVKLFETEEEEGVDTMVVKVEGLPPDTCFTVFLHEFSIRDRDSGVVVLGTTEPLP